MNGETPSRYWFPAKKYGSGWGLPTRWQGWLSMFVFIGLMIVNAMVFAPDAHPMAFFCGLGALNAAMVLVCYLTGEPPAWRWGDRDVDPPHPE